MSARLCTFAAAGPPPNLFLERLHKQVAPSGLPTGQVLTNWATTAAKAAAAQPAPPKHTNNPGYRIRSRLNAITAMPEMSPMMLSCPVP